MSDDFPEDKRKEIFEQVRYDKCKYWSNKYERCKELYKTTTEEDATCAGWYFDLWTCIGKNSVRPIMKTIKGYEHHH
eukprot:CAMPEP_0202691720 /NCGR_PEP_ID=MMETSP1385-20130828/6361_1 /ASSEMBLY_ACC=CAM_ASM_000861 /TAXON_ID=933848 /ORGANISM="Elphidium margaritaceum" /LENGTH=76 /DNA_ID=CAMNT_0049347165 /DNA_START=69 /DNA_END=302 /DNA_ORIENTATION=+